MNNKSVILFDGVCNLCASSVQFIIKRDKNAYFKFASLQSDFGKQVLEKNGLNTTSFDTLLLLENDKLYDRSSAALRIARHLSFPWFLLYANIIIPKFIRDFFYNIIAKNRYKWFGKKEECWLPTPELKQRFL